MRVNTREYSTEGGVGESTIQGTIGKGEKGIGDEVVRERVALEAPEHLNEKEAEIFGRLAEFFEPVELEVCFPLPLYSDPLLPPSLIVE